MPTYKYAFAVALFAFFSVFSTAYATSYNYLPNDVYIKQQEEKSALEYRLKSLESQLQNSPTISISVIDQRIAELRQEWETEKTYTTGTLAQNGTLSTWGGASEVFTKIDNKYSSQISALEAQKSQYQQQVNNQADVDRQIEEIQKQMKEIDEYYDKQRDTVIQKYQTDTAPQKQATIGDLYEWLETLPADEWSAKINLLKVSNPANYLKIVELYRLYHPEFFTQNEEVKTPEITPTITTKIAPLQKTIPKKTEEKTKLFETEKIEKTLATSTTTSSLQQEIKQPEQSFVQKVFGFFRKLKFW